jgi:putative endonuclease
MVNHARRRKQAELRGRRAEWLAAIMLVCKGYRISEMRYRTRLGEIDLIARKGDLAIMVEVKARNTVMEAVEAVNHSTRRRINAAADLWLGRQPDAHRLSIRFDIVAVIPWRWPAHFKDAF